MFFWPLMVSAQTPMPLPEGAEMGQIFAEVVKVFTNWKGLTTQYKIAGILFIIIALFKHSSMRPTWDKLGRWKPLIAPILSLLAFSLMVQPFTVEAFVAAMTTGAAAGYFAQIVDALKTIPIASWLGVKEEVKKELTSAPTKKTRRKKASKETQT